MKVNKDGKVSTDVKAGWVKTLFSLMNEKKGKSEKWKSCKSREIYSKSLVPEKK